MTFKKIITFAILAILASPLVSCLDKKEINTDVGKEASPQDIQNAINNALSKARFIGDAQVNESVSYETNIRVEQGSVRKLKDITHTLTKIEKDVKAPDVSLYTILQSWTTYDYSTGNVVDSKTSEFDLPLRKAALLQPQYFAQLAVADNNSCDGKNQTDGNGLTYDCIKYFNLVSEYRVIDPPPYLHDKVCAKLENCKMKVEYLQYDISHWRDNKAIDKVTISAEISMDMPDLMYEIVDNKIEYMNPPVLSLCSKGYQDFDGVTYMITQCNVLRDFN